MKNIGVPAESSDNAAADARSRLGPRARGAEERRIVDGDHDRPRRAARVAGFVVRLVEDHAVVPAGVQRARERVHPERLVRSESGPLQQSARSPAISESPTRLW